MLHIEFQVIPRHKGFGTVFSHLKSLLFVVTLVGMELYAHCNRCYNPYYMFFMGFWGVFVMHNVGHESSHGSPSRKPWVNDLYQIAMSLTGGTSTLWWTQWHTGTHLEWRSESFYRTNGLPVNDRLNISVKMTQSKMPFSTQLKCED